MVWKILVFKVLCGQLNYLERLEALTVYSKFIIHLYVFSFIFWYMCENSFKKIFHTVQEIGLVSFFSEFRPWQGLDQWQMTSDDPLD